METEIVGLKCTGARIGPSHASAEYLNRIGGWDVELP